VLATALLMGSTPTPASGQHSAERFWDARTAEQAEAASDGALAEGRSFDALWQRLEAGPSYAADVPTGRLEFERLNEDGTRHRYFIVVPASYDPGRRHPVRVYLHGGVSRAEPGPGGEWWRRWQPLSTPDHIAVFPASWNESLWWQGSQIENLRGILADLKGTYNVDENRVQLFGVSDGGTGAYYVALKDPTPWAAFVPFIGHAAVLMNPRVGAAGEIPPVNLVNSPLYIVNGEVDRLYPVRSVRPWVEAWEDAGVDLVFVAKPGGHDVSWWSDEAGAIDAFMEDRPREPHPADVVWAVEPWAPYTRAWWVVIEELDPGGGPSQTIEGLTGSDHVGLVRARREGNAITLDTNQVQRVRLLLSPQVLDLSRPLTVTANGDVVFEGRVEPDPDVLLKWAATDRDRTMLYAAELVVEVAPRPSIR
jgi:predicted esterase